MSHAVKGWESGREKKKLEQSYLCSSLAEWEGFEPSSRVTDYTISNRARYDHFDTTPSRSYRILNTFQRQH